jgi:hypothetical protein
MSGVVGAPVELSCRLMRWLREECRKFVFQLESSATVDMELCERERPGKSLGKLRLRSSLDVMYFFVHIF